MTSTHDTKQNPNDVFWLARYAHNQTAPLFAKATAVEPSIHFSIEITFADVESVYRGNHIKISSHWDRKQPIMFQHTTWLHNQAAVDLFIKKLAADVANLQPLEAVTA